MNTPKPFMQALRDAMRTHGVRVDGVTDESLLGLGHSSIVRAVLIDRGVVHAATTDALGLRNAVNAARFQDDAIRARAGRTNATQQPAAGQKTDGNHGWRTIVANIEGRPAPAENTTAGQARPWREVLANLGYLRRDRAMAGDAR